MKKTKAPEPPSGPAVVMLPIERLAPGPNVRHLLAEEHAVAVDDLICSLRADPRILDPLHVYHRAVPEGHKEPDHLIIHGQRRFLAALAVGLKEVPCVVVLAPTERERLVEQLHAQGKPISPVDEARAVNALVVESHVELAADQQISAEPKVIHRYTVAAAHLGRPVAWVRACVRLLDLAEPVLDLIHAGRLDPDDARPLFAIDPAEQPDVIAPIASAYDGARVPASAIREAVQRHARRLAQAPFDVEDPLLNAAAGKCSACPFRSNAQAELFDGPAVADDDATCLDGSCWKIKLAAHLGRVRSSAAERGYVLAEGKAAQKLMPKERLTKKGRAAWIDLADPCPIPGASTWSEALDQALDGEGTERPEGLPEITVVLHPSGKHSTIAPRGPLSAFVRRRIDPEGAPVPPPPPEPLRPCLADAVVAALPDVEFKVHDAHGFARHLARVLVEEHRDDAARLAARLKVAGEQLGTVEAMIRALADDTDPALSYLVIFSLLVPALSPEAITLIRQRYDLSDDRLWPSEDPAPPEPETRAVDGTSAETPVLWTPAISEQEALDAAIITALKVKRPMSALLGALRTSKVAQLDPDGHPAEGWSDLVSARVAALVAEGKIEEQKHKKGTTWIAR